MSGVRKRYGGHRRRLQILKWLYQFAFSPLSRFVTDTTVRLTPLISNLSATESKSFTWDFIVMSVISCVQLFKKTWLRSGFPVTTAVTSIFLPMSLADWRRKGQTTSRFSVGVAAQSRTTTPGK